MPGSNDWRPGSVGNRISTPVGYRHGRGSREAEIGRYLKERQICIEDVGYIWLWCDDGVDSIDDKNYGKREDSMGHHTAQAELRACSGRILGPSCLRPGFKESIRRR